MIATLTPNPSLDRAFDLDALERGRVIRARAERVDAGGKAVNVARALAANGRKASAVLPAGGAEGRQLAEMLEGLGIEIVAVPVADPVRTNVTLTEPDGTVTKVNSPGPRLAPEEVEALVAAAAGAARHAEWLVCSGSLPPGAPEDLYARVVGEAAARGSRVAVDTSGPPLTAACTAGPDLVKPNLDELSEAAGRPLRTLGDVLEAAEELRRLGAGAVLVSLGADGALLVDAAGALHGEAPVEVLRGAVGAGDALLAGYLAGGEGRDGLVEGLAWGAAACSLPGTRMPSPEDLRRDSVRIHPTVQHDRPLGGADA